MKPPTCVWGSARRVRHPAADGDELLLGDATIEVVTRPDRIWRAPSLVLHHVAGHGYSPPAPFQSDVAAMAGHGS